VISCPLLSVVFGLLYHEAYVNSVCEAASVEVLLL